jgi:hypothetical protein
MRDGQSAAAIAHYRKALAIDPANENAKKMLRKLTD